jgi:bacillithiol biosynthesis deacetylase BshB1
MPATVDILAFSPHPDDAELGCGGSLLLAAERGLRVAVADLSAGELSSRGTPDTRWREKEEAAAALGLAERRLLGLPDGALGSDPAQRLPLIQLLRELRPRIVLAPYSPDRHPDHSAAGRLVEEACFLAGVSRVGAGQPHRPEWVYFYMIHTPFAPSFVVDISAVWERKRVALAAYRSQFSPEAGGPQTAISRPGFLRAAEARAAWFGAMIGADYGEPFHLSGPVPQAGLPGLEFPPPPPGELPAYRAY